VSSFERRSGRDRGHDGAQPSGGGGGKPGGSTPTDGLVYRASPDTVKVALGAARENLRQLRAAIAALETAVDPHGPRDLEDARAKADKVKLRRDQVREHCDKAQKEAPHVAPELLGEADELAGELTALELEIDRLLARRPPSHAISQDALDAFLRDPEAVARLEAAERREREDWNQTLDRHAVADSWRAVTTDPELRYDETRSTIDDNSKARQERQERWATRATTAKAAAGPSGAATTNPEARYDETRSTIDESPKARKERQERWAKANGSGDAVDTSAETSAGAATTSAGASAANPGARGRQHRDKDTAHAAEQGSATDYAGPDAGPSADAWARHIVAVQGGVLAQVDGAASAGDIVDAEGYWSHNQAAIWAAIRTHFASAPLPQPHPRVAWAKDGVAIADGIARGLQFVGGDLVLAQNVPSLLYPADVWKLIDDRRTLIAPSSGDAKRPVGTARWNPAVGGGVALAIEEVLGASLARMGGRYAALAEQSYEGKVEYDGLVTSHPFDRVTARLFTTYGLVHYHGPVLGKSNGKKGEPARATDGSNVFRNGLRFLTNIEWLGANDLKKWNWLRVHDVADPTPEEVALAVFPDQEAKTYLAYGFISAPPFFGLPPEWARRVPDMAPFAPPEGVEEKAPDALAIAGSELADDAALAQVATKPANPGAHPASAPDRAALLETLHRGQRQIGEVFERLLPWNHAGLVMPAHDWIVRKRDELASVNPEILARWARVIEDQQSIVFEASAGIVEVLEMAKGSGVTGAEAPSATPFLEVLALFATVVGESHLVQTARAKLDVAKQRKQALPIVLLARTVRESRAATNAFVEAAGDDEHSGADQALAKQEILEREEASLERQASRGAAVDGDALEATAVEAAELSLRGRARELTAKLDHLSGLLAELDRGGLDEIANQLGEHLSDKSDVLAFVLGRIHELQGHVAAVRAEFGEIELGLRHDPSGLERLRGTRAVAPDRDDARVLTEMRKERVNAQQARFAQIAQEHDLQRMFSDAVKEIGHAQIRHAIMEIAALIGISIISAGAGSYLGGVVRGTMMGRAAVSTGEFLAAAGRARLAGGAVAVTTEATLNAAGQAAMSGESFGDVFLTNLLSDAGVLAALRPFHAVASSWGKLDEAAMGLWQKVGTKVVLKGAVLTGEMITGAAVGYVAQRIVSGKQPPDQDTMLTWAVQGASIAAGRFIAGRMTGLMERLGNLGEQGRILARRAKVAAQQAKTIEHAPDPVTALRLLDEYRAILDEEAQALEILSNRGSREALGLSEAGYESLQHANAAAQDQLTAPGFLELPLRAAGLREDIVGAMWSGTRPQIETALRRSRAEVLEHDEASRRWRVRLGERELVIDEVVGDRTREVRERKPDKLVLAGRGDEELNAAAQRLPPVPGYLDVVVHGSIDDLIVYVDGEELHFDHRRLATYIKKSGRKYEKIRLVSCRTGGHAKGVAQHLANKLGVEVLAPTHDLHIKPDGSHIIGPSEDRNVGEWKPFDKAPSEFRFTKFKDPDPQPAWKRYGFLHYGEQSDAPVRQDPSSSMESAIPEGDGTALANRSELLRDSANTKPLRSDSSIAVGANGPRTLEQVAEATGASREDVEAALAIMARSPRRHVAERIRRQLDDEAPVQRDDILRIRKALEQNRRLQDPAVQSAFARIADFRQRNSMPPFDAHDGSTGTVAMVDVGGSYFGTNSKASPGSLELRRETLERLKREGLGDLADKGIHRVQALLHAEGHALMEAYSSGVEFPPEITLYTDRESCQQCLGLNGLTLLMQFYGIEKITIVDSLGASVILPRTRP